MPYVYSTLSTNVNYTDYHPPVNNVRSIRKEITIKGGANVANKNLVTPLGVANQVTEEELELLENHPVFKMHKKNGFIKVDNRKVEIEKVASDMVSRDQSAPVTPNDFGDEALAKPSELVAEPATEKVGKSKGSNKGKSKGK